jgi:kynureninase
LLLTRADCEWLDHADTLRHFRARFLLPDGIIYLDGNSLGALPAATAAHVRAVVEQQWGSGLIRSWNTHGWFSMQQRVGEKIGGLIGARPGETLVADSTSVNLFKLLAAALDLRPDRRVILSEAGNFGSDLYVAERVCSLLEQGHELRLVEPDAIDAAMSSDVAVVMLTHVSYRTGRLWNMAEITRRAHEAGALMLWDLAHSAGAMPLDLAGAGVDLAIGCGYKFLNGGPGAPAFLYVSEPLQGRIAPALSGWFGHADPFAFETTYRPAQGIARFAVGTPPVISLAALEAGVDLMLEAPMTAVREKSLLLGRILVQLAEQRLSGFGFDLASPALDADRGSQVCLSHAHARPVSQALMERGVIGDFRAPDIMRFGFAPLYTSFADLWDSVTVLRAIMTTREWDDERHRVVSPVT